MHVLFVFFLNLEFFLQSGQQYWALWDFLAACPCICYSSILYLCLLIGQIKMLACLNHAFPRKVWRVAVFNTTTFTTTAFSRSMTATTQHCRLWLQSSNDTDRMNTCTALLLSPQISFSSVNLSHCLATHLSASDSFTTMAFYKSIYLLKNAPK